MTQKIKTLAMLLSIFIGVSAMASSHNGMNVFGNSKTPWQKLTAILYSHGVDTTNLTIMDSPDTALIMSINPELSKALKVRFEIKWKEHSLFGDVITPSYGEILCDYMKEAYKNNAGEKYDYYKTRYSINDEDYYDFLERYPNSQYYKEMSQKGKCVEAYYSWFTAKTDEDCHAAYQLSLEVKTYYEGFAQMKSDFSQYMATVDDWDALMREREAADDFDCDKYKTFKSNHGGHLAAYYWILTDSLEECEWRKTIKTNTITAYRNFAKEYPSMKYACDIAIEDLQSFADAQRKGTHQTYAQYRVKQLLKGFEPIKSEEALDAMKRIEQPEWNKISKSTNWYDFYKYMCKYPEGAFHTDAYEKMLLSVDTTATVGFYSKEGKGLLYLANVSKIKEDVTFEIYKSGKRISKNTLKPGQYISKELPVGNYYISSGKDDGMNYEIRQYIYGMYVYWFQTGTQAPRLFWKNSELGNNDFDKDALKNLEKAAYERAIREIKLIRNELNESTFKYLDISPDEEFEKWEQIINQFMDESLQSIMQ